MIPLERKVMPVLPKVPQVMFLGGTQMAVALYEQLFRDETKLSRTKSVADDY